MDNEPDDTFGFELLYQISSEQLTKKEDVLVLFTHWFLLKHGFKCIGIGDSKVLNPEDRVSEILPNGWNQGANYTLRYMKQGKLYILMGIKSESNLLLNLLSIHDHQVLNVQLAIDLVQNLQGSLELLIPNHQSLTRMLQDHFVIHTELIDRIEISTQTSTSENSMRSGRDNEDPLRTSHDVDVLERHDFWRYSTF